ncbi:MAG: hypothetical protein HOV81_45190 [Kofleriaceae bacterium]|nr:hypothetical protein [Kofleriaceae bacterium]
MIARGLLVALVLPGCFGSFRDCPVVPDDELAVLPAQLSQTGLFADIASETLAPGVMPYTPRFALWSDGATKRRWIYLPPDTQIDSTDPDAWNFPPGTKLWKEFTRDGVRVETRILFKHGAASTDWTMAAYVWTDGDAALTPDGVSNAAGTAHDVPSASQCHGCHGGTRSGVLGVSAVQLAERGEGGDIGLADLVEAGRFTAAVAPTTIPGDDTTRAALGYLHANCSHCHNQRRPPHDGPRCFDPERSFDFTLRTTDLDAPASTATYRTAIGKAIKAGNPGDSEVMHRIRSRDPDWGMPALGTEVVDDAGVATLETWIRTL